MAAPSGWQWINEYWKLYAEFGNIWRQLQERLTWYANLQDYSVRQDRLVAKLTDERDQLVVVNRRIMSENQALREGASETRGQVTAEAVDKITSTLLRAKSS